VNKWRRSRPPTPTPGIRALMGTPLYLAVTRAPGSDRIVELSSIVSECGFIWCKAKAAPKRSMR
jgi:hypothetical protein